MTLNNCDHFPRYEIEFILNSSFSVGSIPCRCREDGFGFAHNQDFPNQSAGRACGNQSGDEKPPTPELLERPDAYNGDECQENDSVG